MADQVEREDKYDVPSDFQMPALLAGDKQVAVETFDLAATYFDTAASHLQRRRITMRRRQGGHDAGWHLKLPAGDARIEVHLDGTPTTPPDELLTLLIGVRGNQPLVPVVRVSTVRTTYTVSVPSGGVCIEVADDQVTSDRLLAPDRALGWREVEVELGPAGEDADLRDTGALLMAGGARRSASLSKLGTAMGPPPSLPVPDGLLGMVASFVRAQVDALAFGDLGLRRGDDSVYPMRVAVRRLRSTLLTYGQLLAPDDVVRLHAELQWFGRLLGQVRDLDVLGRRFAQSADDEPGLAAAAHDAARLAQHRRRVALADLLAALTSPRYLAVVSDLDRWHRRLPLAAEYQLLPSRPKPYLQARRREVADRLADATSPNAVDTDLHELRKAYKRLRYALELAESSLGRKAKRELARARTLQDLLGEHQDSAVAVAFVRDAAGDELSTDLVAPLVAAELRRCDETREAAVLALTGGRHD